MSAAELWDRFETVERAVEGACRCAHRERHEVTVVAVSKKQPVAAMECYYQWTKENNLPCVFGENYVQELIEKRPLFPADVAFHFLGHLQTNKMKLAVENAGVIESVDREKLAVSLSDWGIKQDRKIPVYIQVNISGDEHKGGFEVAELRSFLGFGCERLPGLQVLGVMTITKDYPQVADVLPDFRALTTLVGELTREQVLPAPVAVSMGMSRDFELAIGAGATVVRVGTALFGER